MDEANVGDVFNINNQPGSSIAGGDNRTDSVVLSENDLIRTMQSAMLIRGEIRCRLSTKFSCGYEIRPIIWFAKRTPEIDATLNQLGLTWKQTYVKTEDIAKLTHAFQRFFNLSVKSHGLKMVARLNGVLPQPLDYDEVQESLAQIEKHSEALNSQSPSDESRKGEQT